MAINMDKVCTVSAVMMVAGALVGIGTGTAAASTCVSWTGAPTANPSSLGDTLQGVSVVRPCDVWVVGYQQVGSVSQTLTEHWNGLAWTPMPSANPGGSSNPAIFASVAVRSATDAWAVGHYSNGTANQTLIELLSGGTWDPRVGHDDRRGQPCPRWRRAWSWPS